MANNTSSYYVFLAKRLIILAVIAGTGFWAYNRFYKGMQTKDLDTLFALVGEGESMDAKAAHAEVMRRASELKADAFEKYVSDEHDAARALAAEAMGKAQDDAAIKNLKTLLKDPVAVVRLAAARACKRRPNKELIPVLISDMALEKNGKVKAQIGGALQAITGENFSANLSKWQNWYALNKRKLRLP